MTVVATTSPRAVMQQVRALPQRPGVYLMRDAREDVIYIGKATDLRSRVRSYFGSSRSLEAKVRALAEQVVTIDHIITATEAEALHLEASLVKRHQPTYNVRLKDDKHYPYLKVDVQNAWPRVTIARRVGGPVGDPRRPRALGGKRVLGQHVLVAGAHDIHAFHGIHDEARRARSRRRARDIPYSRRRRRLRLKHLTW